LMRRQTEEAKAGAFAYGDRILALNRLLAESESRRLILQLLNLCNS
jgi:hypothetical protein